MASGLSLVPSSATPPLTVSSAERAGISEGRRAAFARLALLDKGSARSLFAGRVAPALRRFARDAAPLTFAAVALLAGLYLLAPGAGASPPALLALHLVLISALTLPHVVVVSWMDARQGLWRRGEASG